MKRQEAVDKGRNMRIQHRRITRFVVICGLALGCAGTSHPPAVVVPPSPPPAIQPPSPASVEDVAQLCLDIWAEELGRPIDPLGVAECADDASSHWTASTRRRVQASPEWRVKWDTICRDIWEEELLRDIDTSGLAGCLTTARSGEPPAFLDRVDLIRARVRASEEWDRVHTRRPTPDVRVWRCNFLAFPGYEMGDGRFAGMSPLSYTDWADDRRTRFRRAYAEAGMVQLPYHVMPDAGWAEATYDLDRVLGWSHELRDAGLVWAHFLVSDRPSDQRAMDADEAIRWVRYIIPRTDAPHVVYVLGWEFPLRIQGWTGDDFKLLEFLRVVRSLTDQPIYLHLRKRWWGGTGIADGDPKGGFEWEDPFLRAFRAAGLTGLLYQSEWDARTDNGSDEAVFYRLAEYPRGDGARGTLDRVLLTGVDFIFYEHSRFAEDHARRVLRFLALGKGSGYC